MSMCLAILKHFVSCGLILCILPVVSCPSPFSMHPNIDSLPPSPVCWGWIISHICDGEPTCQPTSGEMTLFSSLKSAALLVRMGFNRLFSQSLNKEAFKNPQCSVMPSCSISSSVGSFCEPCLSYYINKETWSDWAITALWVPCNRIGINSENHLKIRLL